MVKLIQNNPNICYDVIHNKLGSEEMKRIKLKDRTLPTYSKGEEIFNMTSHIVGGGLGVIFLIICIAVSAAHKNIYGIVSGIIFGISMIVLYTMSSVYHGLSLKKQIAKKVMQILDHDSIFILIAGSYTPFALCTLREYDAVLGWSIFAITWGFSILGIVLNSIDLRKYRVFSMICYILMGWCIIFRVDILPKTIGWVGTILLVIGGVFYTVGAILYGLGRTKKWMHSIFHLFIVLGNVLQAICIIAFVL